MIRALIAIQVGFCFLVVFVAGLLVSTFQRLSGQPAGFPTDRLLTLNVVTPRYNEPISSWQQIADALRKTPGIQAAAFADWPLLDGYSFKMNGVSVSGGLPSTIPAWFLNVSPGWLATMGIPILDGRDFRPTDLSPGAAIVNESFANQYFAGVNPLGQFFEGTSGYMRGQRFQIVGVVHDTRYRYLRQPVVPVAYTPFHRMNPAGTLRGGTFVVRTAGANPLALASILGREVTRIRPEFGVSSIHTQKEIIETQTIRERLLATLALFFGLVAVLLAGIGLYGALDYSVVQRRREIGIRRAIGAQAGRIVRHVTFDILLMVMVGAMAGAGLGLASVRYLESLLFQVRGASLDMLAAPALTILAACLLAAMPALVRAVRIDPAEVLHGE